jgi:hypothetical protein
LIELERKPKREGEREIARGRERGRKRGGERHARKRELPPSRDKKSLPGGGFRVV